MDWPLAARTYGDVRGAALRVLEREPLDIVHDVDVEAEGLAQARLVALEQRNLDFVLRVLLRRAIRVTPEGGRVCIRAENLQAMPRPLFGEDLSRRCVQIEISDAGPRVGSTEVARAMWTAVASDGPDGDELAEVYRIILRSGGRMDVRTGQGTTFCCYLPSVDWH